MGLRLRLDTCERAQSLAGPRAEQHLARLGEAFSAHSSGMGDAPRQALPMACRAADESQRHGSAADADAGAKTKAWSGFSVVKRSLDRQARLPRAQWPPRG